jgi:predicted dehydrogenase
MNKAKIGVIGAGWWATEFHIPHLKQREDVELVSVCKIEEEELKFVKEKFGFKHASTNYVEMLDMEPLDGVVIASPHFAHFENIKAALTRDCHVLVEKPMTTNTKDALEVSNLLKEKKVELLTPYGFNWNPLMAKAEKYIQSGIIGKIQHVDSSFSSSLIDLFKGVPLSESDDHIFQPKASTWSDPSKAGGYGWGQLSHMFAGVYKITKLSPKKVFCMSVPSPTGVDYTDAISLRFESGATGAFSGSAFVPKGYGGGYNIRVHGDQGTLFLDFEINRERLLVRTNDGEEIKEDVKPGSGTHAYSTQQPLNTLVDICLGKEYTNHGDININLKMIKTLDAAYRSMKSEKLEMV